MAEESTLDQSTPVNVQVAKLAREHAELVLIVGREDGHKELDGWVRHAQLAQPAQVGDFHTIAACTQRWVGPAHSAYLQGHGQVALRGHLEQHLLEQGCGARRTCWCGICVKSWHVQTRPVK